MRRSAVRMGGGPFRSESGELTLICTESEGYDVVAVGNDRPGIVRDLARVLSRRHVNVEELHTSCEAAPMAGGMLFRATALVRVPGDVALDELRAALESLADDLMVELSLSVDSEAHGAG